MNAIWPQTSYVAQSYSVEIASDLDAVRPQWEALENQGTPFQKRPWLLPWFRVLGPKFGATPLFVTVREETTRRPLMLFPLCLRRWRGLRTIEFPDLDVSDYNMALTAEDFHPTRDEINAIWRQIRRALPAADFVRFDKVPSVALGRDNPLALLDWVKPMETRAWLLDLPASKADYDDKILTKKARKENRRKRKNLAEAVGDFQLVHASTPEEGREIFETMRAERRARFGMANILERPAFREFYQSVIFDAWGPFTRLSALEAGGKILATLFAIRQPDEYLLIIHSFEPDLESLSPGIVAIDEMIGDRIAARDRYFDFTVGNEGYKKQFGVHPMTMVEGLDPLSVLGRLYVYAFPKARRAKQALGRLYRNTRARLTPAKAPPPGPAAG